MIPAKRDGTLISQAALPGKDGAFYGQNTLSSQLRY
jgi:hypothetical protein